MAWTTPRTWVVGELVSEAQLNAEIRDKLNLLKTSIGDDGRILALIGTYLANLSGTALTGIAKLASTNLYTAGTSDFNQGSARLVAPVGASRWAT